MKKLICNFIYNLKNYVKYITKVGFKELGINALILIFLAILAAFAYMPVSMIADLLRNLLSVFISFDNTFGLIYMWIFDLISALAAIGFFMFLFNLRYDFKNDQVVPIEGTITLKRKNIEASENKTVKKEKINQDLDLPKEKEEK